MSDAIGASGRFAGRRALVTGAAAGIGFAIAERFAAEGAGTVLVDRDAAAVEAAVERLRARGLSVEPQVADVADESSMVRLAAAVGGLDVVVANAGVQTFAPVLELTAAQWDALMAVNARGAFLTLQLAGRQLRDGGAAVAIASVQARLANPLSAHYAASKAAVLSLVRSFAATLAPRAVRVNAVAPGRIETGLADLANRELGRITGRDPSAMAADRAAANPLGRSGRPDEVAAAVAFLASDDASYITGECLHVTGGDVMP